MSHPETARGGWKLHQIVYDDDRAGIAVALMECPSRIMLALRWLPGFDVAQADGSVVPSPTWMDGPTDWFILPFDFAVAIGKSLIEKKVAGLHGFQEPGFTAMVQWLVEHQAVSDAMCY